MVTILGVDGSIAILTITASEPLANRAGPARVAMGRRGDGRAAQRTRV